MGMGSMKLGLKPMREGLKIEMGIHEFEFEIDEKEIESEMENTIEIYGVGVEIDEIN